MVRGGGSPQGGSASSGAQNRTLRARFAAGGMRRAIWKKSRRGEIGSAAPFLDGIAKLSEVVRIQSSETLLRDATETALRIGHPVYDSLYIACAGLTGSVLVTADRRLGKIVSDRVPEVEVITLRDGPAMANVEAAGIRLVER